MMVALLLYAYALGRAVVAARSSAAVVEDVAFRVISRQPGARSRDDRALPACVTRRRWPGCSARCSRSAPQAGLVRVGVVAVDGTKIAANASERATRSYEQIAREILEDAAAAKRQWNTTSTCS